MVLLALWRPSLADERAVKQDGARKPLNYLAVGATREPDALQELKRRGWNIDRTRVQVGKGDRAFRAATDTLRRWGQFQLGWSNVDPATPVAEGTMLAVTSKTLFLWNCNPLRIVYNAETRPPKLRLPWQPRPPRSFRLAHGCVEGHMLAGEESFGVEMDREGAVW
ncbi:hypothetical protein HYH03_008032 [Edaphochlamys debaryana]|uniref:DUF1990 domain-containing protein n=1 Tax=Edaphochlamys debaryana TaxID=47281 RepID=A0A836BZW1_9CHLO|nr:hypothetical protein HYH03_008032 [Edaphochlamys debaryana]|eukprot:KAG2493813.1 hypothetical protein HYH03_008032 [Edaphochlamys debaryana]